MGGGLIESAFVRGYGPEAAKKPRSRGRVRGFCMVSVYVRVLIIGPASRPGRRQLHWHQPNPSCQPSPEPERSQRL